MLSSVLLEIFSINQLIYFKFNSLQVPKMLAEHNQILFQNCTLMVPITVLVPSDTHWTQPPLSVFLFLLFSSMSQLEAPIKLCLQYSRDFYSKLVNFSTFHSQANSNGLRIVWPGLSQQQPDSLKNILYCLHVSFWGKKYMAIATLKRKGSLWLTIWKCRPL